MNKRIVFIVSLLLLNLLPVDVFAAEELGEPVRTWTYPVIYALDQEVTWFFDLTDSGFIEGEDIYLWAWSPSEPDAGNFDNSSEFAKLEYVGNMIWKKTFIPTQYFGLGVADIENSAGFWMRLKRKGNDVQSGVINMKWSVAEINTFKESGEAVKIFPEKFNLDDPLSLLVNAEKIWVGDVEGGLVGEEIHLHSGLNNFQEGALAEYQAWIPEISEKTKLTHIGSNIYKIDFVPREYFGVSDDFVMENIEFLFPAKDWAKVGTDQGGKNFVVLAPDTPIPPEPVFYFFPQRFSQLDILTLVRLNNERNTSLSYSITGGGKTIEGKFAGNLSELRAYINLFDSFSNQPSIDKISLLITNQRGDEIVKTDIPLVPLSDLQ